MNTPLRRRRTAAAVLLAAAVAAFPPALIAQQAPTPAPAAPKADNDDARLEFKANDLLNKGLELLELKQDERAIKLIASVPQMFPKSKARLKANLALGKYYASRGSRELALSSSSTWPTPTSPTSRPRASTRPASATTTSRTTTRRSWRCGG